jgi:hypothetical protein
VILGGPVNRKLHLENVILFENSDKRFVIRYLLKNLAQIVTHVILGKSTFKKKKLSHEEQKTRSESIK